MGLDACFSGMPTLYFRFGTVSGMDMSGTRILFLPVNGLACNHAAKGVKCIRQKRKLFISTHGMA